MVMRWALATLRVPATAAAVREEITPGARPVALARMGAPEAGAARGRARQKREPGARQLQPVLALGAVEPTADAVGLLEVAAGAGAGVGARHVAARAREVARQGRGGRSCGGGR